ncbi:MAG: hypothetical protein GYA64_05335, partial [Methanomicrobiales archaeon]|nr:hypothetical protein [Methanomicrobiales archaeon]
MKSHTQRMAFLAIVVCLCLIGGVTAQQGGENNTTTSPAATTSAGGANATDLTNAGAPQAVKLVGNNTPVTTFGNVSGFTPEVSLELVANNFTTAPMMVTTAPGDDSGRLYVVDQIGVVKILDA